MPYYPVQLAPLAERARWRAKRFGEGVADLLAAIEARVGSRAPPTSAGSQMLLFEHAP